MGSPCCFRRAPRPSERVQPRPDRRRRPRRARRARPRARAVWTGAAGRAPSSSPCRPPTSLRHRPGGVEGRGERPAALHGDEAVRRLEADDAAAGRRDPDRPCGVGAERGVAEARGESRGRASARSARVAVRRERVADVAEVLVLGGDPVGELVQVGLPDDRVAPGLEARDGGCRPRGDVLGEDRRPVGRPEAGRVEEVLDAEADPVPWLLDLRDEGVQARLSRRRARSRRR